MTTNFDESNKYCIIKWIDWMFYIWFKVRDLFSHRKHFFSENYDIGLGDISRKDSGSFSQGNGHNSFWNQFCMIYIQPLSLHSEGQSWSTRLSEKSRKRLEFFLCIALAFGSNFFKKLRFIENQEVKQELS